MDETSIQKSLDEGIDHQKAGRLKEAEAIYRQILTYQPNHADALYLLGALSFQKGHGQAALELLNRAITLNPSAGSYYANLGVVLATQGKIQEALTAFRQSVNFQPDNPDNHFNLGTALHQSGQIDEAIVEFRKAMSIRPEHFDTWAGLARTLQKKGETEESLAAYQKAASLKPDNFDVLYNLGFSLQRLGRFDQAVEAYRKATALMPNNGQVINNFGVALQYCGRIDEAIEIFRKALELEPHRPVVHGNLGMLLLLKGDFKNGWAEYEWRCQTSEWNQDPARARFLQPRLDERDINGQTVLLHTEQGYGDAIHFARYAPLVAARGAKVIFESLPPMAKLFKTLPGVEQVVSRGEPLPRFDLQCSVMTLGLLFGTNLETIPANVPYLSADPELSRKFRERMPADDKRLKVGLCWAGQAKHDNDKERSIALTGLEPLATVPGVHFYSLQKGDQAKQSQSPPPGMTLTDWTDQINDFADTAALIDNLDLVVTVDTAVAHLAGAMGKPVWVLVPPVPDWRWMLNRTDSPWYPTMKLYRKPGPGQWEPPLTQLTNDLKKLVGKKKKKK